MWVDLALRGAPIVFMAGDLAWYRIHDRNIVRDRSQMLASMLDAANLIVERLPAEYRRLFIEETVRYAGHASRALLNDGRPAGHTPLRDAVEGLQMLAQQFRRAHVPSEATGDVIDELRLLAVVCKQQGQEEDANRCLATARMLTGIDRDVDLPRLGARLLAAEVAVNAHAGTDVSLPVRVRNESDLALRTGTYVNFGLSYHLRNSDGSMRQWDNSRVPFERALAAHEEILVSLPVAVPGDPGDYLLEIDVVCEGVMWLADAGSETVTVRLTVSPAPASEGQASTPAR